MNLLITNLIFTALPPGVHLPNFKQTEDFRNADPYSQRWEEREAERERDGYGGEQK